MMDYCDEKDLPIKRIGKVIVPLKWEDDAQIDLLTGIYNFVDENRAFRECINPQAKRFEVKYKKYSPAMLEGFADHCLTLEELLMWRVPK